MSIERRLSPRKVCAIPIQFKVLRNGNREFAANEAAPQKEGAADATAKMEAAEGQALNVSERGMYFTSRAKLSVGQSLEMNFVLPAELTGRQAEQVKCSARVMHIDYASSIQGVGVSVERFEAATPAKNWSH